MYRHDERAVVEIRRWGEELHELEDFLASAKDYRREPPEPFERLVDQLSEIRRQALLADLLVLSRQSEGQPQEQGAA